VIRPGGRTKFGERLQLSLSRSAYLVEADMMGESTMSHHRDAADGVLAELHAAELEHHRNYAGFCARVARLGPLEKATAWLEYIADHRAADGDLEAVVFLASRGYDVTSRAAQIMSEWKDAERERIADYNEGTQVHHAGVGGTRRRRRPLPITINEISSSSRMSLRNFWSGRVEQQLTIDATMLRATEWMQIGGFDHWWERLAQETAEDALLGGFEGMAGAFWLFGMCRSELAMITMAATLNRQTKSPGNSDNLQHHAQISCK
jgi:hypothetical protein